MGMGTEGMLLGWLATLLFLVLVLVALVVSVRWLDRAGERRRDVDGAPGVRPSQGHTLAALVDDGGVHQREELVGARR
jgi:hypothetical protein